MRIGTSIPLPPQPDTDPKIQFDPVTGRCRHYYFNDDGTDHVMIEAATHERCERVWNDHFTADVVRDLKSKAQHAGAA